MLVTPQQHALAIFPVVPSTCGSKLPLQRRMGGRSNRHHFSSSLADASSLSLSSASTGTALYSMSNPITMAASAVATVPSMAATVTSSSSAVSFVKLFLAFVAGGLFFSSAIAAVTACYAVGMDNVQRFARMAKIVLENIWSTFVKGLLVTRDTLLGKDTGEYDTGEGTIVDDKSKQEKKRWKWRDAWRVLKLKLQETKETAVEGVEAIRNEAKLYAAAVGAPGLIPLQYVIDRLMPYSIAAAMEDSLKEALVEARESLPKQIKKLTLKSFTAGTRAPKLESARVYDLGPNAMAFDCDVVWDSEVEAIIQVNAAPAGFGFAKVPVTVKKVKFEGTLRVVLSPLTKEAPGFGAAVVAFPTMPKIGLDVRVAGSEVTKILPRLRSELMSSIRRNIADSMLWPKRIVVPSTAANGRQILSLNEVRGLALTDPMLKAEAELALSQPMLRKKLDHNENTATTHVARETSEEDLLKSVVKLSMVPASHRDQSKRSSKIQNGILWDQLNKGVSHVDK